MRLRKLLMFSALIIAASAEMTTSKSCGSNKSAMEDKTSQVESTNDNLELDLVNNMIIEL